MKVDNEVDIVANIDLGSEKESRKECDGIPETDFKGRPNLAGWCRDLNSVVGELGWNCTDE